MVDGEQPGIVGLVFGGNEAFELFGPVEDHTKPRDVRVGSGDHEKAIAVRRHVIALTASIEYLNREFLALEQGVRSTRFQRFPGLDRRMLGAIPHPNSEKIIVVFSTPYHVEIL